MKAAVLTEAGFEIRELDTPPFGDDEVLIKTTACGVCSGDVFVYKNREELAATHSLLGHEGSGLVAGVGQSVTGFAKGDVVTALGMPAYAEYFVTAPEKLVKLPPEIDPVLALGEAIACCVHAGNRFGTRPGDRTAVVGCGFMGLICLQLVKYQRAGYICAIDPVVYRLDISRQFGADTTLNPMTTEAKDVVAQHGEFDIVIEAAGTQSAIDLCTDLVKEHGRIILVGYHQSNGGIRTVNMQQWNYKAIDVINGHVRREDEKAEAMRQGVELMRQGHLVTAPLVTTYDLTDIEAAFRALISGRAGLFKAVLLP
jgi:threonine dehydrogenase-like Zn-dependent dehydrogenase